MTVYAKNAETGCVSRAALRALGEAELPALLALFRAAAPAPLDAGRFSAAPEAEYRRILLAGEVYGLFAGGALAAACCWHLPSADAAREDAACLPFADLGALLTGCFTDPRFAGQELERPLLRHCIARSLAECGHPSLTAFAGLRDTQRIAALFACGFLLTGFDEACLCLPRYRFTALRQPALLPAASLRLPLADSFAVTRALWDGAVGIGLRGSGADVKLWLAQRP